METPVQIKLRSRSFHHRMAAEAQVKPEPNDATMMISPSENFPSLYASDMAMGMEAAVVFPYL